MIPTYSLAPNIILCDGTDIYRVTKKVRPLYLIADIFKKLQLICMVFGIDGKE